MSRIRLLVPLLIILAFMVWALPALLKAVPDRYVARLPEPLQQLGLPEEGEAILPTVARPVQARDLLLPNVVEAKEVLSTPTLISTKRAIDSQAAMSSETTTMTEEISSLQATPQNTPTNTPTPSPTPWPLPVSARLNGFQHKFQTWNNCGPATLAMALTYFDMNLSQEDTAAVLKPNPEDRNVSPQEMAAYVNELTPSKALFRANGTSETLRRLIANDIPVIIELGIEPPGEYRWMGWYGHYLLVVAYDDELGQFWVYDSWFGTSEEPLQNANPDGRLLSYADLETYWPHFNRNYIVLFRAEQEELVTKIIGMEMDDQTMWADALARLQSEVTSQPENAFLWFNLGTAYNALQQYESAATAFDQARAIGLPWRMLWYQFGPYEAYLKTGRYDEVILLADVTLQDRPYFEESYYYKGLALAAMGDQRGALRNLQDAVNFNPNFLPAVEALEKIN